VTEGELYLRATRSVSAPLRTTAYRGPVRPCAPMLWPFPRPSWSDIILTA